MRRRLDAEMVRRRLAESRTQAARLIESGQVLVGGAPADKPARMVSTGEAVTLTGPPPRFVGRGGEKLDAALDHFGVAVAGRVALDAGSSTGGFTDCLLQRGAARVVAVDVGRGQLHDRLRNDSRVEGRERTDIRAFAADRPERFPLVVADLSFISLRSVAAALVAVCCPGADLVVLVKPQFEAGRAEVSRGRGVVRDPEVWRTSLIDAIGAFSAVGATNMGVMVSPLRGADGNVEFLAYFSAGPAAPIEPSAGRPLVDTTDAVPTGAIPPVDDATLASTPALDDATGEPAAAADTAVAAAVDTAVAAAVDAAVAAAVDTAVAAAVDSVAAAVDSVAAAESGPRTAGGS